MPKQENFRISQCTRQLRWATPTLIGLSAPAKIGYRLSAAPVGTLKIQLIFLPEKIDNGQSLKRR